MLFSIYQYAPILFVFGLCLGSFLNVVIYRYPLMMQQAWQAQCDTFSFLPQAANDQAVLAFNLCVPASHCPSCKKAIPWWRNIPLLSYLLQRGRCHACQTLIPLSYPLVELLAGSLVVLSFVSMGWNLSGVATVCFSLILLALMFIDIKTLLLPDDLTLSLLWLGLLSSLFPLFIQPKEAILGAVVAYLSLWGVGRGFYFLTHREGMGYGDYKLAAAIGAWIGWQAFPLFILIAAILALFVGGAVLLLKKKDFRTMLPFGPFLAFSGWLMFMWGHPIQTAWYGLIL